MARRHPLSVLWGDMPEAELLELAADIKKHGQKVKVVLFEEMILDGWHRAQACQIAGLKIEHRTFDPETEGDPRDFVRSQNAFRRHLTPLARGIAIASINQWRPQGVQLAPTLKTGLSKAEMAKEANVSARTITTATKIVEAGLGDDVLEKRITAREAVRRIDSGKPRQERSPDAPTQEQAEIMTLRLELSDVREKNAILLAEIQAMVDAGAPPEEQKAKFEGLYRQLDAAKSQIDEWMQESAKWQKEALALRKKIRKLEKP